MSSGVPGPPRFLAEGMMALPPPLASAERVAELGMKKRGGVLQLALAPDDGPLAVAVDRLAIELRDRRAREQFGKPDRCLDQVVEVLDVLAGVGIVQNRGDNDPSDGGIDRSTGLDADLVDHGDQLSNLHAPFLRIEPLDSGVPDRPQEWIVVNYLAPADLDDALAAFAERKWTVLAGGTDFYPARVGRPLTEPVIDISRLDELRGHHGHRRFLSNWGPYPLGRHQRR